jgi:hypothetical protein
MSTPAIGPAGSIGAVSSFTQYESGALTNSGILTGSEILPVAKTTGLFQTTLTTISNFISNQINPVNLPQAGTLTGSEIFGLSQGGNWVGSPLSTLATFILSQQPPGSLLTDTGTANTYSATNPAPYTASSWVTGITQQFIVGHTNTGASTYAPDGLPPISILGEGYKALTGGELQAGGVAKLMKLTVAGVNSGNPFCVLLDCTGGPKQVANAITAAHAITLAQVQGQTTNIGTDNGTANTYAVTFVPALTAPIPYAPFWFPVKTTNTGASTLNGTGTYYPIVGAAHTALQGGEMLAGGNALIYWNPTLASGAGSYVLLMCSGAPEQVATGTQPGHATNLGQVTTLIAPALQPGMISFFGGMSPPTGFLAANGAAISRTTYSALFGAVTVSAVGTVTSGSNSITADNDSGFRMGGNADQWDGYSCCCNDYCGGYKYHHDFSECNCHDCWDCLADCSIRCR